jgi:hypothetical protein
MDCAALGKSAGTQSQPPDVTSFGILAVEDQAGARQELYFGGTLDNPDDIRFFAMPPVAPQGSFDVRFTNDARLVEGTDAVIQLQSAHYPMTVSIVQMPEAEIVGNLIIEEMIAGQAVAEHILAENEPVSIAEGNVDKARLSVRTTSTASEDGDVLPGAFRVVGNYPNPFNPTTTLLFDLPASGTVSVKVFDLVGRQVLEVPAAAFGPGAGQEVQIDASALASGIYIYRIEAAMTGETTAQAGRMTLLK